jgi:hypothetical protein
MSSPRTRAGERGVEIDRCFPRTHEHPHVKYRKAGVAIDHLRSVVYAGHAVVVQRAPP